MLTTTNWTRVSLMVTCAAISLVTLTSCYKAQGHHAEDKRKYIRTMSHQALIDLYKEKPGAKARLEKAVGYAVFSDLNVKIIFVGSGQGYGMAVSNATKKETFMRMGELGAGFGLGVSDFRTIMVFHDQKTFHDFLETGIEFSGKASAEAQAGDQGGGLRGQALLAQAGEEDVQLFQGVEVYQLTKNGVMAQAMLYGTKYWKDHELN